jgi:hypothetical protein
LGSVRAWNPKPQKGKDRTEGYPKMDNMVVMVNIVTISSHRTFTEKAQKPLRSKPAWEVNFSNKGQA